MSGLEKARARLEALVEERRRLSPVVSGFEWAAFSLDAQIAELRRMLAPFEERPEIRLMRGG